MNEQQDNRMALLFLYKFCVYVYYHIFVLTLYNLHDMYYDKFVSYHDNINCDTTKINLRPV